MINLEGKKLKLRDGSIVIVEKHDKYINITVNGEQKCFAYCKAFKSGSLTAVDNDLQEQIMNDIAEIEKQEADAKAIEEDRKRKEKEKLEEKKKKAELFIIRKKNPNDNMVFRSQICDGGTEDYSNWFKAPCSKRLREYHIKKDNHRTWCNVCSICKDVCHGEKTEANIKEAFNNGELCYESTILLNHNIKAGWDTNEKGVSRPRSWRLSDDHLAVLMTVEPGAEQSDAIIYSAFLTSKTTKGDETTEGSTSAAGECFIDLTIEEARQMRLWDYLPATAGENSTDWRSGLFRYISDVVAARILCDMVSIVEKRNNEKDTKNAKLFLNRFLQSYGGDINNIPPKSGALMCKQK